MAACTHGSDLGRRIQALPAELYNHILDETALPAPGESHPRPWRDRIPIGLHLNRAYRSAAADRIYSNLTIKLQRKEAGKFTRWWLTIHPDHAAMISAIHLTTPSDANLARAGILEPSDKRPYLYALARILSCLRWIGHLRPGERCKIAQLLLSPLDDGQSVRWLSREQILLEAEGMVSTRTRM